MRACLLGWVGGSSESMARAKRPTAPQVPLDLWRDLRIWVLSSILLVPLGAFAAQPPLAYPPALRGEVVDDYHGVKVSDPYRWLEQLDSAETRAWVLAEARLTDSYLKQASARQALKKRLTELLDFEKYGIPF